jgi:O-antigen/teichoic acid export membrane protein
MLAKLTQILGKNNEYSWAVTANFAAMGTGILVQIVLIPFYYGHFSPTQFGAIMVILSLVNFAAIGFGWISGSSLRLLTTHWARGDRKGFSACYRACKIAYMGYAIAISALGGILLYFVIDIFSGIDIGESEKTLLFVGTCVYLVFFYDMNVDRVAMISARQQASGYTLVTIMSILQLGAIVTWVSVFQGGLGGVMMCYALGALGSRLVAMVRWRQLGVHFSLGKQHVVRELKAMGSPYWSGFSVIGVITTIIASDVTVVGWLFGLEEAGLFVLAWKLATVFVEATGRVVGALAPYIIRMDVSMSHRQLRKVVFGGLGMIVPVAVIAGLGYSLVGPAFIAWWVAPKEPIITGEIFFLASVAMGLLAIKQVPVLICSSIKKAIWPLSIVLGVEMAIKYGIIYLHQEQAPNEIIFYGIIFSQVLGPAIAYWLLALRYARPKNVTVPNATDASHENRG